MTSKFIHCDCDCFFAAIEMRDDPARRLCRDLIIIPPNMEKYVLASQEVGEIFRAYTDLIEPLSLDEAFLDVTDSTACKGSASLMAREIRQRVRAEVGIILSAGIAPNKFLAKIASEWNKPDGQFVVTPAMLPELFADLQQRIGRARHEITVGKQFVKLKFNDFVSTTVEHVAFSPDLDGYRNLCRAGFERGNKPVRLLGLGVRLRGSSVLTQLELPLAHSA